MLHQADLTVLAQELAPPSGTSDPANNTEVLTLGSTATALLGSVAILLLLRLLGRRIPGFKKFDDIARVVVALIGVTGVIAHTEAGRDILAFIEGLIGEGSRNIEGREAGFGVIFAIFVFLATVMYYQKDSFLNLLIFAAVTLPLYRYEWLHPITEGYTENIAQPFFSWVMGAIEYVVSRF